MGFMVDTEAGTVTLLERKLWKLLALLEILVTQ